eukprot:29911-Eustigmatos_ZCMA.PRE.1
MLLRASIHVQLHVYTPLLQSARSTTAAMRSVLTMANHAMEKNPCTGSCCTYVESSLQEIRRILSMPMGE